MAQWTVFPENEDPPKPATALAEQVEKDGGRALALYREPVGQHWQIFCLLPPALVEATPYQRDLSPTHVKRLQECVKKIDRFVDPIVAMSPRPGLYWTPNGNHRRTVLEKLKAKMVPAILVPEPEVAYQILALNTEKAHNLKEKSLEVIRMYTGLVEEEPSSGEEDYAFQFEAAALRDPGAPLRAEQARSRAAPSRPFSGAWTSSSRATSAKTLAEREERAAMVRGGRRGPRQGGGQDQEARHQPSLREELRPRADHAAHPPAQDPAFLRADVQKLTANIEEFDVAKVRYEDVQRAGIFAAPAAGWSHAAPPRLLRRSRERPARALRGWTLRDGKLHRDYEFPDFVAAFGFMTAAAHAAEALEHHPDWSNAWNRVTVDLSTHDAGGLTELDFALAGEDGRPRSPSRHAGACPSFRTPERARPRRHRRGRHRRPRPVHLPGLCSPRAIPSACPSRCRRRRMLCAPAWGRRRRRAWTPLPATSPTKRR